MSPFDSLCASQKPVETYIATNDTFECDYDQSPTSLYEALEEHAWHPALQFLETGYWEKGLFLMQVPDPLPPARQARTWVTRMDNGVVRWSQLPIHAALIFGAPHQVVEKLVELYPQGVRCTDDQHMLPIHLAMKFGAADSVIAILLQHFPESIFTKDLRGRLPTELVATPRNQIMESIIQVMQKTLGKKHADAVQKATTEIRDDLKLQAKLNAELERDKKELENNYRKAQAEITVLKTKLEETRLALKKQSSEQVELTRTTSSRSMSQQRKSKEETRDCAADSTVSVGGGSSVLEDVSQSTTVEKGRKDNVDKVESQRKQATDSSIGGESRLFRSTKFFKGFGTSSVKE